MSWFDKLFSVFKEECDQYRTRKIHVFRFIKIKYCAKIKSLFAFYFKVGEPYYIKLKSVFGFLIKRTILFSRA